MEMFAHSWDNDARDGGLLMVIRSRSIGITGGQRAVLEVRQGGQGLLLDARSQGKKSAVPV